MSSEQQLAAEAAAFWEQYIVQVAYELKMLRYTTMWLVSNAGIQDEDAHAVFLESFVVHFRTLYQFLAAD